MSHVTKPAPPSGPAERSSRATMPELVIPSRFRGPSGSGNGGYVCGRIAAYADGPVAVTLRRPPPLAAPMTVEQGDDGSLRVRHGSTLIAEATSPPGLLAPEVPDPVSTGGSPHGGRPRAVLPGPGLPRVLCLRDEPPARRRAADLPRAGARPGAVGGAVDTGFLGRRRRTGGCGRKWPGRRSTAPAGSPPPSSLPGPGHRHRARPDDGRAWRRCPRPATSAG